MLPRCSGCSAGDAPMAAQAIGQLLLMGFVPRHNGRTRKPAHRQSLHSARDGHAGARDSRRAHVTSVRRLRHGCAVAVCDHSAFGVSAHSDAGAAAHVEEYGTGPVAPCRPVAALATGYAVALAPVVARNWIVARQAVAMVTPSPSRSSRERQPGVPEAVSVVVVGEPAAGWQHDRRRSLGHRVARSSQDPLHARTHESRACGKRDDLGTAGVLRRRITAFALRRIPAAPRPCC